MSLGIIDDFNNCEFYVSVFVVSLLEIIDFAIDFNYIFLYSKRR